MTAPPTHHGVCRNCHVAAMVGDYYAVHLRVADWPLALKLCRDCVEDQHAAWRADWRLVETGEH